MCSRSADRGALPRDPGHQRAAGQVLHAPGPQPRTPPGRRGLALPGGCVLPAPAPAGPPTLSSGSVPRAHPGSSCAAGSPAGSLRSPSAPRSRPDPASSPGPSRTSGHPGSRDRGRSCARWRRGRGQGAPGHTTAPRARSGRPLPSRGPGRGGSPQHPVSRAGPAEAAQGSQGPRPAWAPGESRKAQVFSLFEK